MATEADKTRFRKALMASTDKYVKQQGRNTMAENAARDAACEGYARIPGPDACEFCVTMGAHDHFYRTRATAGGDASHGTKDDLYHAYCNCQVAMVFRRRGELVARDPVTGEATPYDGAKIVRRYREAGSPTFRKNRAAEAERRRMRRADWRSRVLEAQVNREAMARLSAARSVDELEDVADEIVESWGGRKAVKDQVQWDEMSRFAKNRHDELLNSASRNAMTGSFEGSFGKNTQRIRAAYFEVSADDFANGMVALFNKRHGGILETEGNLSYLGKGNLAAFLSGVEYGGNFVGTSLLRVKLISTRKLKKGVFAQTERRGDDVIIRVNANKLRGMPPDQVEQIAFHEMAHTSEYSLTSVSEHLKEVDVLLDFQNKRRDLLPASAVSKHLVKSLEKAGVKVRYSEVFGKIEIGGRHAAILERLPEYARKNADLGTQDSELVAECIRYVALHGYGYNEVADVVAKAFIRK